MKALPPITKRLDDLAKSIMATTGYAQYSFLLYEASAEIERLEAKLAAAKAALYDQTEGITAEMDYQAAKEKHYEECAVICDADLSAVAWQCAQAIREAIKGEK